MFIGDLIGAQEACSLLKISRPTLDNYRKKFSISDIKIRREVKFSKKEILTKLYTHLNPTSVKHNFNMHVGEEIERLKIDEYSYDLRKIDFPDGHGAISLLCHFISEISEEKYVHLLIDESNTFLKAMNFFEVLKRYLNSSIFLDEEILRNIPDVDLSNIVKLPIRRLGVVGSQNSIVDDLTLSLIRQGYSEDICAYIGWAMGELADNSATHAQRYPSFVYFEQYGEDRRYLQFSIGDIGIGIPDSLRENRKYTNLTDKEAILYSFKPNVSGRTDEEDRGKGLTDVLKIAMECSSRLRVDSNGIGIGYYFNQGIDNFDSFTPLFLKTGTIISILFIDDTFGSLGREDVDEYLNDCMERL